MITAALSVKFHKDPSTATKFLEKQYVAGCQFKMGCLCCVVAYVSSYVSCLSLTTASQIAKFMGPTWGPPGSCRPQVAPCWPHESCYQGWHSRPGARGSKSFISHKDSWAPHGVARNDPWYSIETHKNDMIDTHILSLALIVIMFCTERVPT